MSKKQKNKANGIDNTAEIIKKVKSVFLETVVREWLNTPMKEWGNKTVLELIKSGKGQEILDTLKKAEQELKNEKKSNKNDTVETIEEDDGNREPAHHILSRI
jgi:heterodisulfide reductase subunit C